MQSTPEFFIFYFLKKRAASKVPNPTQYNLFRSRQESYCSQRAIFPIMGKILSRGQEDALFQVGKLISLLKRWPSFVFFWSFSCFIWFILYQIYLQLIERFHMDHRYMNGPQSRNLHVPLTWQDRHDIVTPVKLPYQLKTIELFSSDLVPPLEENDNPLSVSNGNL